MCFRLYPQSRRLSGGFSFAPHSKSFITLDTGFQVITHECVRGRVRFACKSHLLDWSGCSPVDLRGPGNTGAVVASGRGNIAGSPNLQEALIHAYRNNPQLLAGREALRVTNEQYPQAIAEWLPSVSTSSSTGRNISKTDQDGHSMSTTQTFNNSVTLSQTLYKGGQNFAGLRSAAASIDNQRVTLATV